MTRAFLYLLLFLVQRSFAQGVKDTIGLKEVIKIESNQNNTDASPFTDVKYRIGQKLGDALTEFSSVYVKNYGSGGLSSVAIEGTSAEQTSVEWNGVKLNSPSLGLVDLSLFIMGMQDEMQLVRTGYEGSIGGTLKINNVVKRDSGFSIGATLRAGSFGTYESMTDADYAKGKFSGTTKFGFITDQNNFTYNNTYEAGTPVTRQTNAAIMQLSALQQVTAKLNQRNELSFIVWYTNANRQIPPIMSQPADKQTQYDYSIRTMAVWKGKYKYWKLKATTAFLQDWMRYKDPNALLDETYSTYALRNNFECVYNFPSNVSWRNELNFDHEWVNIHEYGVIKTRNTLGLKSYCDYYFLRGFKLHVGFREDFVDRHFSAFSPEITFNYRGNINAANRYVLGITASRNFRFPTFDDLYWLPGGNADLKEEVSWNGRFQAQYAYRKTFDLTLSNFYVFVDNWIQWIPQGDNWKAENFRRVFSRGFEASIHITNADEMRSEKFAVHFTTSYTYTKATNLDAFNSSDASKGMQMIYVPFHNAVACVQLGYKRFYIRSINNYTGLVYTSTDNSQSVNGYFTSNLEAGKDFVLKHIQTGLSFKINNIGNLQYQVVAQRPMPGRNFELTFRFKFSS